MLATNKMKWTGGVYSPYKVESKTSRKQDCIPILSGSEIINGEKYRHED